MLHECGLVPRPHCLKSELLLEKSVDAEHFKIVVHDFDAGLLTSSINDGGQLSTTLLKFKCLIIGVWEACQYELVLVYSRIDNLLEHLDNKFSRDNFSSTDS